MLRSFYKWALIFLFMDIKDEEIFEAHLGGKIGLRLSKGLESQKDLAIVYTPGVAKVCLKIAEDPESVFDYTSKKNSVAIMSDGSAVLGLGDIGPLASIPVMEGKAVLFKKFGNIDAWPVVLDNVRVDGKSGKTDVEEFIRIAKSVALMYGGFNLEDIAAPACFEIEKRLDDELDIPVFHDDQWGTAIIVLAGIKNYSILSGKKLEDLKVVVNGAGSAGIRIVDMLKGTGVEDVVMVDSKGVISSDRDDLNEHKRRHAMDVDCKILKEAIVGRDVFIGVSVAGAVTGDMILSMNEYPAIFALANPVSEISPEEVAEALKDKPYVMATGRSDYPNQINNVLGFPYIFRGALDAGAKSITMEMKKAASDALAELAREGSVSEKVEEAYGRDDFEFGPNYIIPVPFDERLLEKVGGAVRRAAEED